MFSKIIENSLKTLKSVQLGCCPGPAASRTPTAASAPSAALALSGPAASSPARTTPTAATTPAAAGATDTKSASRNDGGKSFP